MKLQNIICSTRPGRVGPAVAAWFHDFAVRHGKFEIELIDLAEVNLPLYDEPHHPRLQKYTKDHTKRWAQRVAAADAYVFITPEYNYGPPPAFINALNYVYLEWNYKPCAFVSYGGISGGMRAVQLEKQLVTTLKMMPMVEGVVAPMVSQMIDAQGRFIPNEYTDASATLMLDELLKWSLALRTLRD
jgi:NAD(P)H-dependent FMN reductase